MKRRKNTQNSKINQISNILKSKYLPYIITFSTIGILFVLIRMKAVEQQLKLNDVNIKIERVTFENKDLKAKKAKLLSVGNLRKLATEFDLKEPSHNQIIVVP